MSDRVRDRESANERTASGRTRTTFNRYVVLLEQDMLAHFRSQRHPSLQQWKIALESYIASTVHRRIADRALRRAGFTEQEIQPTDASMAIPYTIVVAPDDSLVALHLDKDAMWRSHQPLIKVR
jgi:hypothetical protein